MPKLSDAHIGAEAEDGQKFEAKVGVDVLTDGTFSIECPEELADICEKIQTSGAHVGISRSGARPRVYAPSLKDGLRLLKAAADDYLRAEEVTERVICYTASPNVSFWEEPDGTICPNGCGRKGKWWAGKLHGHQFDSCHRLDSFSVGIAAKVFDKITTKRASGNRVRYVEVERDGHDKHTDPCQLLNGWTVLDVNPKTARQMPYTPEAALFFHEVQKALCKMARSLDDFISDDEKLMLAIQAGGQLLLK